MARNDILCELFEDIEIPERLKPENIAFMLKQAQSAQTKINKRQPIIKDKKIDIKVSGGSKPTESIKTHRTGFFKRVTATAAAFVVMVVGLAVYFNHGEPDVPIVVQNPAGFDTELRTAEDYTALYNTFRKVYVSGNNDVTTSTPDTQGNTPSDPSPSKPNTFESASGSTSNYYSALTAATEDNYTDPDGDDSPSLQQFSGISDADIVKTDGNNLYYIANGSLNIVSTDNGQMTLIASTKTKRPPPVELFITADRLVVISVITEKTDTSASNSSLTANSSVSDFACFFPKYTTVADIYDITNKQSPSILTTYEQSGSYITSKMIDSDAYIVTSYSNGYYSVIDNEEDFEKYVPSYSVNGEKKFISAGDISIPAIVNNTNYTILSGLNVTSADPVVSTKAILGYDGKVFMTKTNAYIAGYNWENNRQFTNVAKFSISGGMITHSAYTKVTGYILSRGSMDEFKGNFRIATSDYNPENGETTNNVYVYDSSLKKIGELSGFASGENLNSVKFDGSVGYILSGNQNTPTTGIDFTKPSAPSIMTDLKTANYSTFFVKYGTGMLLSFGTDTDANGTRIGFKLSMFDASSGTEIVEIAKDSIDSDISTASSYAELDRKALFVSHSKNLIGIPISFFDGVDNCNRYYLFRFDNETKAFVKIGMIETHDTSDNAFVRAVNIGDTLYVCAEGRIVSTSITDMSVISVLDLRGGENTINTSHGGETLGEIEVPDDSQDPFFSNN